jgi:hypothetical protein
MLGNWLLAQDLSVDAVHRGLIRIWYPAGTSVGQLLGKAKWERPLADWIMATGVGLLGNELRDNEAERVERNDGWRRELFI